MERWAANTLRTVGIILTAGLVLVLSLGLAVLSMCAAKGGFSGIAHSDQAAMYMLGAILVVIAGVANIAWLARGIYRSTRTAPDTASEATPTTPLHLSPPGRQSIHLVILALAAQIVTSAAIWIFNQLRFWSGPRIFAPFPSEKWLLALLIPFVLYHIPYAILIYVLLKRPDRRAFAYSLAVPAVLIMQSLLSVAYGGLFLNAHPVGLLLLFIPWALHIVILVLAYKAIQQVGLHPEPSSLIAAAVATFVFFAFLQGTTSLVYRAVFR